MSYKLKLNYSLEKFANYLVYYLANHPLMIDPPVYHIQSKKQIKTSYYRQGFGIPINPGFVISVYPGFSNSLNPNSINDSLLIPDIEKSFVHYVIHLYWSEVNLDNINVHQVNNGIDNIPYHINPGFQIISEYLELIRFIIEDKNYYFTGCNKYANTEYLKANYITSEWSRETNVYWHQGTIYLRFMISNCKDWKESISKELENILIIEQVDIEKINI